jgi:enamine deaminase RidA (YjgF/YER057c/UK114 family)
MPPTMGFSHVAEITGGKLVILSGQLGNDVSGKIVEGGFAAQVAQAFANAAIALKAAGGSFANVAKMIYVCDAGASMPDLQAIGAVRDKYVNVATPPASEVLFVPRFVAPGVLFELSIIAAI